MTLNKKLIFWAICIFLFCWFFYSVREILLPFVAGIFLAYLLDPIADWMEERKVDRGYAAGILVVLFLAIFVVAIMLVGPILFEQVKSLAAQIPKYVHRFNEEVLPVIENKLREISPDLLDKAQLQAQEHSSAIAASLGFVMGNIWQSSMWLMHLVSLIVITPVVAFYILRDWDKFIAKIDRLLPREYAPIIEDQAAKIDEKISLFLRGQVNICLILALFYGITLTIVGLNFGFLIGFLTGLLAFVPYAGFVVGCAIGMGVAFFQYGASDYVSLGFVAGVFAIGQILEGYVLVPRVMGNKIGVHPAWLIFGMLAGGALLGFVGVLIAVPVTAIVGVLARFALEQYEGSEFYQPILAKKPRKRTKKIALKDK